METTIKPINKLNIKCNEIENKNWADPASVLRPDNILLSKETSLRISCNNRVFLALYITSKYVFFVEPGDTLSLKNTSNKMNKIPNANIVIRIKNNITPNKNFPLPIFVVPINLNTEEFFSSDKVIGSSKLVMIITLKPMIPGNIYSILKMFPSMTKRIPGNTNARIGPYIDLQKYELRNGNVVFIMHHPLI